MKLLNRMFTKIYEYIKPHTLEQLYANILTSYKNTLHAQNMYTINEFIRNIKVLHDDVKKAGYSTLLAEIEVFQNIVTYKTDELMRFHREIR